jgi:hypothetical protein
MSFRGTAYGTGPEESADAGTADPSSPDSTGLLRMTGAERWLLRMTGAERWLLRMTGTA